MSLRLFFQQIKTDLIPQEGEAKKRETLLIEKVDARGWMVLCGMSRGRCLC